MRWPRPAGCAIWKNSISPTGWIRRSNPCALISSGRKCLNPFPPFPKPSQLQDTFMKQCNRIPPPSGEARRGNPIAILEGIPSPNPSRREGSQGCPFNLAFFILFMLLLPLTAQAQVAPCPQNEINGVFQLTNQYRAMYRQAPVQWSQILGSDAYGHAYWMASANLLSHMDAYGMRVRDRVTRAGYGEFITTVAENIAAGQGTAVQVMEDWKRS